MSSVWRSWVVLLLAFAMAVVTGGCSNPSASMSVSLSPSAPQEIDQDQTIAFTATVINDSSSKGVSWNLSGPGSLSKSTAASVIYNPPTTNLTDAQQVTVTATAVADQTKKASVRITVNPFLEVPFQTLANGSVGAAYNQTIALTGGTPPYQWSVYNGPIPTGWKVGGSVPDGLRLDPNSGAITGTPTGAGTWYFEIMVTDATGATATNGFLKIKVNSSSSGNPVPFLSQPLSPTAVPPGNSGFVLHMSGTGFVSGSTVNFNHIPVATTFVNSERLTALVPAASVSNAGTAAVTVVNPGPGGGQSNVVDFQVAAPETTVSFAAANSLQVDSPLGITIGDFNEDGKPDLAVAANFQFYVWLGNGDGTFLPAAGSPMRVPSPPYDDFASPYSGPIATGDFNRSGHMGLAVGLFQNQAAVVLLGNGNGTFEFSSATFAYTLGDPLSALQSADFNGDGGLDLAIVNEFAGQSPVVLGYGSGAFSAAGDLDTGGFGIGLAIGDVNDDGKLDTIVASAGTNTYPDSGVAVSLGNGDGTFTPATGSPMRFGSSLSAVVTGDFNGDGKLDLAVTDSVSNDVMILLGNGDGTFGLPTSIPAGNQPMAIIAGDFNNDDKLDLAIANYVDNTITLLLGNGDGTFTPASGSPYPVGQGPYQIAAGDFNGDGKLDLAVTNLAGGTVSILLQQ